MYQNESKEVERHNDEALHNIRSQTYKRMIKQREKDNDKEPVVTVVILLIAVILSAIIFF